ncbi:RNA-directed DNA polymerase, eukaryota, partial [Tanacetum coccineum]
KGGLGVSSFYAMNRALMFKWDWRFRTDNSSLWARFIKAMHGEDGLHGKSVKSSAPSIWLDIIRDLNNLKNQGIDLLGLIKKKIGNGCNTSFWEDNCWRKIVPIKVNILAWKTKLNLLPSRLNLSRRGLDIPTIMCPICENYAESTIHIFYDCYMVRDIYRKIASWWDVSSP